jgi:hypothetical protein
MARPLVPCQPALRDGRFPRGWPVESPAAVLLCLAYCPLLAQCRAAALRQPEPQPGVLGGLTQAERLAARQAADQARAERQREVSRNSERRRRRWGLDVNWSPPTLSGR